MSVAMCASDFNFYLTSFDFGFIHNFSIWLSCISGLLQYHIYRLLRFPIAFSFFFINIYVMSFCVYSSAAVGCICCESCRGIFPVPRFFLTLFLPHLSPSYKYTYKLFFINFPLRSKQSLFPVLSFLPPFFF